MATESKPAEQNKPSGTSTPSSSSSSPRQSEQDKPQPRQGNSGQSQEPGEGMAAALQEQHQARTVVPGHPDVDARLDNRQGSFRPRLEEWPAKPQQIDGPDLKGQIEHTRRTLKDLTEDTGNRKGQFSPGPHGLSDESLRESGTAYGPEGLAEAGPGSKD